MTAPATAAALALIQERGLCVRSPDEGIKAGKLSEVEWREIQDAHSKRPAGKPTPGKYGDAMRASRPGCRAPVRQMGRADERR